MATSFVEQLTQKKSKELLSWTVRQRWFRSKQKKIASVDLYDYAELNYQNRRFHLSLLKFNYEQTSSHAPSEVYFVPLSGDSTLSNPKDAFEDPVFGQWIVERLKQQEPFPLQAGKITFRWMDLSSFDSVSKTKPNIRMLGVEQSNTSFIADEAIVKVVRKMEEGVGPETEMLEFLSEKNCSFVPKLYGVAEYSDDETYQSSLILAQKMVPNQGDGWKTVLGELDSLYKSINLRSQKMLPEERLSGSVWDRHFSNLSELGRLTARLHALLASEDSTDRFLPEAIQWEDIQEWTKYYHALLHQALYAIKKKCTQEGQAKLKWILGSEFAIKQFARDLRGLAESGVKKIRYHGDYHLGQVLKTENSWIIIDFEGEPLRALEERKQKHCALRDVAGMLRSFNYAAWASYKNCVKKRSDAKGWIRETAEAWEKKARISFLNAYFEQAADQKSPFVSQDRQVNEKLISIFEMEKATYELYYELNNRPEWIDIPLAGIRRILNPTSETVLS